MHVHGRCPPFPRPQGLWPLGLSLSLPMRRQQPSWLSRVAAVPPTCQRRGGLVLLLLPLLASLTPAYAANSLFSRLSFLSGGSDPVETLTDALDAVTTSVSTVTNASPLEQTLASTTEAISDARANFTQSKLKECLAVRMGEDPADKLNVKSLMYGARRRLAVEKSADPACSVKSPYMVLVDQFDGINALGGTRSGPLVEHNITSFKTVGAALGCFVVSLDPCTAQKLLEDSRIAITFPLESAMKQQADLLSKIGLGGTSASSDSSATTTSAEGDSASATKTAQSPIVLHVTLADDDGVMDKITAWKQSLADQGVDTSTVNIEYSGSTSGALTSLAADDVVEPVRTRYMILSDVPPDSAGIITRSLAAQSAVEFIERSPPLRFLNQWARGVTQSGDYQVTPLAALGLDGTGQIIGVADTGLDMNVCFLSDAKVSTPYNSVNANHRKVVTYIPYADNGENFDASVGSSDPIGHGTHVSSTVAGNTGGSMAAYNGMASNAKLAFFDIAKYDKNGNVQLYPPGDLNSDMLARLYNAGARVFSMSWGSPDSNCYSSYAVMVDEFMWNNPDALVVFAAGNSGTNGGYTVVTPSTAKSCITVGASYNMMQTSFGLENNIKYVAYFSSIGPTADGRLKPDIVAPGYYIRSAHNGQTCGVVDSRGTSMATPVVAGNAALIRQYLMSGKYQNLAMRPSGALLKAMLIHSAQKMTAYEDANGKLTPLKWPDVHQGYGRIQDDQVIDKSGRYTLIAYGTHNQTDPRYRAFTSEGDVHNYQVTISSNATRARALRVTLVWTDRPASAVSCQQTKTSVLINDLDLHITDGKGNTYYPQSTGGAGPDRYNPVEQVVIANPESGGNYTVTVTAHGLVTAQNYALVISGRFAGFQYNETSADVGASNLWGFVKGHTTAVILICVAILFSLVVCLCCVRRGKGNKRTMAELLDGPAMMARTGSQPSMRMASEAGSNSSMGGAVVDHHQSGGSFSHPQQRQQPELIRMYPYGQANGPRGHRAPSGGVDNVI